MQVSVEIAIQAEGTASAKALSFEVPQGSRCGCSGVSHISAQNPPLPSHFPQRSLQQPQRSYTPDPRYLPDITSSSTSKLVPIFILTILEQNIFLNALLSSQMQASLLLTAG